MAALGEKTVRFSIGTEIKPATTPTRVGTPAAPIPRTDSYAELNQLMANARLNDELTSDTVDRSPRSHTEPLRGEMSPVRMQRSPSVASLMFGSKMQRLYSPAPSPRTSPKQQAASQRTSRTNSIDLQRSVSALPTTTPNKPNVFQMLGVGNLRERRPATLDDLYTHIRSGLESAITSPPAA